MNYFNAFKFNTWGSGWPGYIVQDQKNFKRQSLTGKVLLYLRDKASMEPIQEKSSDSSGLLAVQSKDWQLVFIFPFQGPGVSSFIVESNPDHKLNSLCTNQQSQPIPSCLKSCTHFSLTNKCPFCPQAFSPKLGTFFCDKNLLSGLVNTVE